MSTDQVIGSDVNVNEIILTRLDGAGSPLSIRPQVQEIVIYESLFSKFLHGYLLIQDSIGLLNNFPIVGEEKVTIKYRLSDTKSRTISAEFFIFSVDDITRSDDNKSQAYILKFCSEEKIQDIKAAINNAYNEPISNMVKKIVSQGLKSSKRITVEESMGNQQIVFPTVSPTKALQMCEMMAVSSSNKSSSWTFYETLNEGFYFQTIEKLVKEAPEKPLQYFMFTEKNKQARDLDFFNVQSYYFDTRFNTLEKIKSGMVDGELLQYDLITKRQKRNEYKYRDVFNDMEHLEKRAPGKLNSDEFLKKYEEAGNLPTSKNEYSYIITDSSKPATYFEKSYGHKKVYMNSLKQIQGTISVPGYSEIRVGTVIELVIPPMEGSTDVGQDQDNFVSGRFLITNIKHSILGNNKYNMTFDITKDNYRTKINV